MNEIVELYGLTKKSTSKAIAKALETQLCPYTNKICSKMRKSSPEIKIGTCSVSQGDQTIIICPHRLLENNQIFIDCIHLLTLHEPGNELFLIPEVQIPGGNVDYFLVSAKNNKVCDFIGIELQTMDTTGTVWPTRQRFLDQKGIYAEPEDLDNRRSFGMNWKMTLKTILVQMHHKSETFESLNKHLVLIIQKPLFERMQRSFSFNHIQGVRLGDPVHIHSYNFFDANDRMQLSLDQRVSTDSAGIAKSLGLNAESRVELADLIQILERKLTDNNKLLIFN